MKTKLIITIKDDLDTLINDWYDSYKGELIIIDIKYDNVCFEKVSLSGEVWKMIERSALILFKEL